MQNSSCAKDDKGKLEISLVPTQIIRDIAEVRMYGNAKYHTTNNWITVEPERYKNALLRHTLAFLDDEDSIDEESGIPHYKHMACNLAFLCEMKRDDWKYRLANLLYNNEVNDMDVTCSNNIITAVQFCRLNIYGTEAFKDNFSTNLKNNIGATDIQYLPDKFGGWSINITVNNEYKADSIFYMKSISESLYDAINSISNCESYKSIIHNLLSVIITGKNSLVVKI